MSVASGLPSSVSQVRVTNISETVHNLLSERECSIFDKGLSAYHKRRDINAFTECLAIVLNTNRKRQLLVPIREAFVKPSDVIKFNTLAIRNGLALPIGQSARKDRSLLGARKVDIKRDPGAEWGFDVRGGTEQYPGIFVSWVEFGSKAYKEGLKVGDQIHKANDVGFNGVTHYDATQLFKNSRKLRLWVTSHGQIASVQYATKMFRWVDVHGRPTAPPPESYQPTQFGSNRHQLDERKVSMVIREGMELGLSIRGGGEHGLGIYVSALDHGSVADAHRVKVGDQILEVNGVSFLKIHHAEAAKVLRANRVIVLKLKDVGKIPCSKLTSVNSGTWHRSQSAPPPSNLTHITHTLPRGKSDDRIKTHGIVATLPTPIHGAGGQVTLTRTSSPARGMIGSSAKAILSANELSAFNYYITQYEQGYIVIEDFTAALLQLLNTSNKVQLISEVRNIIRPQDLDHFNRMTIDKEIAASRQTTRADPDQNSRYSLTAVGEIEEGERQRAVSRSSTFATSNTTMEELSAEKMREVREQTRRELEETLRRETEQKFRAQFEQEKQQLLMQQTSQVEEKLRQKFLSEREALEKELKQAYDQEKSQLEEKIWQEAEQHIRQELEEEIYRESEKHFQQEYTDRLQQEQHKYERQAEAERRQRDKENTSSTDMNIMEEEEMERIQREQLRRNMEMEKRTQQITMSEGRSHLMPSEERKWSGMALETTDGQRHQNLEDGQAREAELRLERERAKVEEERQQRLERERAKVEEERRQRLERERAKAEEERQQREEIERARKEAEQQMHQQMEEEQRKAAREEARRREEQRLREAERKRREEQRQREQEKEEQLREQEERLKLEEQFQQQEIERQKRERQHQEEEKQKREEQEKRAQEQKWLQQQQQQQQQQQHQQQQEMRAAREQGQNTKNKAGTEQQDGPHDRYWGYTGLTGKTMTIKVTKVNRKLGLAVDGGSNTRQNGVIIRQITTEGCAGLTGIGLEVGQQILAISGKSLHGLKHKEAVIAIKNAFEGPINKVLEFVVLDPNASND